MVALFAISFAVVLVGGLMVVPIVVDEAEAKCDGFKKNGDPLQGKEDKT